MVLDENRGVSLHILTYRHAIDVFSRVIEPGPAVFQVQAKRGLGYSMKPHEPSVFKRVKEFDAIGKENNKIC